MASRRAPPTSSKKTTRPSPAPAPAPAPAKARPAAAAAPVAVGKKAPPARAQSAKASAPKLVAPAKASATTARVSAAPARKPEPPAPAKAAKPDRAKAPAAPRSRRKPTASTAPEAAAGDSTAPIPAAPPSEEDPSALAKLAVSQEALASEPRAAHIPWSYGLDRVTAAAIDPDRLFAYWELTDQAIERARATLGAGGPGAWLALRVHDATGLIFDGTNAHSTFEHGVDRTTRQWFFHVGKPGSSAFVEIGLRSAQGSFAAIARSGRVDFPRRQPAPWREPEWMTVQPWSGAVADVHRASHGGPGPGGGPGTGYAPPPGGSAPLPERFEQIPLWVMRERGESFQALMRQALEQGWERVEWQEASGQGWFALEGRVEWESPIVLSTWESGPFSYPVEIEPPSREEWTGHSFAFRVGGVTHVVHGPWRVVIRNLGARAEGAVHGTWTIYRSWAVEGGHEVRAGAVAAPPAPGASEQVALGASERRWQSGSELRLGGASEVWRAGASELAYRGASELSFLGASEWAARGASERQYAGASERRLGGASERQHAGASEGRLGGASEQRLGGGSEGRLAPARQALPYPAVPPGSPSSEE